MGSTVVVMSFDKGKVSSYGLPFPMIGTDNDIFVELAWLHAKTPRFKTKTISAARNRKEDVLVWVFSMPTRHD